MKPCVAMILIVVGAILLVSPMISMSFMRSHNASATIPRPESALDLTASDFHSVCLASGIIMIGLGIFFSVQRKHKVNSGSVD